MDDSFRKRLERSDLGHLLDQIPTWPRNSIRLRTRAVEEQEIEIGASKIGGCPDLPPGWEWPTYTHDRSRHLQMQELTRDSIEREQRRKQLGLVGRLRERLARSGREAATRQALRAPLKPVMVTTPLSFIAQIRLADVAPHDKEILLPGSGVLYFFYDAVDQPGGYGPDDPSGYRVLYYDSEVRALQRTPIPADMEQNGRLPAMAVDFAHEMSYPGRDRLELLGLPMEHHDAYFEEALGPTALDALNQQAEGVVHRMLGYADEVQYDPMSTCAQKALGTRCDDPRARESALRDWVLLLQVDSISKGVGQPGVMWGDVGKIYFCIQRGDLQARDFSKACLAHECY